MSSDNAAPDEFFGKRIKQYERAVEHRDFDSASGTVHDMFALAEEWCEKNPSPDFDLTVAAGEFEERADWGAAESVYKRILSLSDLEPATEYKAHSDLARLCRLLGRNSDALGHARYATAAARCTDLPVLLAMALKSESRCLIRCGEISEAVAVIAEAISAIGDDAMCNQMRASILTLRAECAVRNGAFAEAQVNLDEAYSLLEPMAGMSIAAGVHSDLSHWWSVTAEVRATRNDCDGSISAWQQAVDTAKYVASLPHVDNVYTKAAVANMLEGLTDALLRGGRPDEAAAATDERHAILYNISVF